MKRLLPLCLALMLTLAACSSPASSGAGKALSREGVAPYALDADEEQLLRLVGRKDARLISFRAPAAKRLSVSVYRLEDGAWEPVSQGAIGDDGESLTGTLALLPREDGGLDFTIECKGLSTFRYDPAEPLPQAAGRITASLSAHQAIELDKEIPVYLTGWGGNTLPAADTQDFFAPEKFADLALVQAVTVTFTSDAP